MLYTVIYHYDRFIDHKNVQLFLKKLLNARSSKLVQIEAQKNSDFWHCKQTFVLFPQDLFVKMGQTLRLDSMLTNGSQFLRESKNTTKSPWEPTCVYANFPHQVLCGDSWGNFALLLGTTAGTFLVSLNTRTSVSDIIGFKIPKGNARVCRG